MAKAIGKVGAFYFQSGTAVNSFTSAISTHSTTGGGSTADSNIWVTGIQNNSNGAAGATIDADRYTWVPHGEFAMRDAGQKNSVVHVSYLTYEISKRSGFFNWTLDWNAEALEVTDFESAGNREYLINLKGWTATAEAYFVSDSIMQDHFNSAVPFLAKFYTNESGADRYEGWCLVNGLKADHAVDKVMTQPLEFTGITQLDMRVT